MKKLKEFIYKNRDIVFIVALVIVIKSWDFIKEVLLKWWPLIVPAMLTGLFLARDYMKRFLRYVIFELGVTLVVSGIFAFLIISFVVQAFKIPTGSMRPTLLEGDFILVNKFIYGAKVPFADNRLPEVRSPERGDVIVFIYPEDRKKDFIKRLVGLPGESVEIKSGTIYVNDQPLLDPKFNQRYYYNRGDFSSEGQKLVVPEDSYFVLGDNSASSKDSRYWGFVPKKNVLGLALIVWWPPTRIKVIK